MASSSSNDKPEDNDDHVAAPGGSDVTEPKRKAVRRRRGNKGRFKPYHSLSTEEKVALGEEETARAQRRPQVVNGKAMAPSNTTQFLLDDREARAEADREMVSAYDAAERQRVRSISVSSELLQLSDQGSSSGESDEMDRDFEAELDEFNMERISNMNREELYREILNRDRNADVFNAQMRRMCHENVRLRALLEAHNIDYHQLLHDDHQPGPLIV